MNKTLITSAFQGGTMKLAIILLAVILTGCVKPWGKPDPPPAPKQQDVEHGYPGRTSYRYPGAK